MIEEMIPVEYWDSAGYMSVPFLAGAPPRTDGIGDTYRIYAFDAGTVKAAVAIDIRLKNSLRLVFTFFLF